MEGQMRDRIILAAVTLAAILAQVVHCAAAGAVAVGLPSDVAKFGVSMGYNTKFKTMAEAKAGALAHCKGTGSNESKALCKIVATFRNRCVAEAIDPKAGTPGFGRAIADTAQEAQNQAMANCRKTAGPSRQDACQVNLQDATVRCDGSAK
jgi:hypothetical protein